MNDSPPQRLNPLLEGLAQAMHSTAQAARADAIERCREDAQAYIELLHTRTGDGVGSLRDQSEADVVTLQELSKARIEQVRLEAEARIAYRRDLLQQGLSQLDASVEQTVQRVNARVSEFEDVLARFCERLFEETDPTIFANLAARLPTSPDFWFEFDSRAPRSEPVDGRAPVVGEPGNGKAPAEVVAAVVAEVAAPPPVTPPPPQAPPAKPIRLPLEPGTLTGAGAVRGRLYSDWYGEVERLKEVGDEDAALKLLLDMVAGTEAESQAEGTYVASPPYELLANLYEKRGDLDDEILLLERWARQQHAGGPAAARLMDRRNALKKVRH